MGNKNPPGSLFALPEAAGEHFATLECGGDVYWIQLRDTGVRKVLSAHEITNSKTFFAL